MATPASFTDVCRLEGSVCSNNGDFGPYGPFPSAFDRPLKLPSVAVGQSCPVSAGSEINTVGFGGFALGTAPARPIVPLERIAHNHPSGDRVPSAADHRVTRALREAGDLLGLPPLDHLIVTDSAHYSFRDTEGWLDE